MVENRLNQNLSDTFDSVLTLTTNLQDTVFYPTRCEQFYEKFKFFLH